MVKKKPTVLLGMTGGSHSTVSAYILIKQGYNVIGAGLLFDSDDIAPFDLNPINNEETIEDICNELGISCVFIECRKKYKEILSNYFISARIVGERMSTRVIYHRIVLESLLSKSKEINADNISTGHYAGISYNDKSDSYFISIANDLEQDQSYLLSNLSNDIKRKLILPLADMRENRLEKVLKLFNLKLNNFVKLDQNEIFKQIIDFTNKYIPRAMVKEGTLVDNYTGDVIGQHSGIHNYYLGQTYSNDKSIGSDMAVFDINFYTGNVSLDKKSKLAFDHLLLIDVSFESSHLDTSRPIDCYVKSNPKGKFKKAEIFFKSNGNALIKLKEVFNLGPFQGHKIVAYSGNTSSSIILFSGFVLKSGFIIDNEFSKSPITKEQEREKEEQDEKKEKVDDSNEIGI